MICIIPQHATSVRLPRKAFRELCGIPLVAWSVIQAKAAHNVDAVYVSTESQEIAEICTEHGAEIIWRPKWVQDKKFAANVPFEHALCELGIQDEHVPFLCKLATAPLLYPDDIDRIYSRFVEADEVPIGMGKQVLLGADIQEVAVYRQVRDPKERMCVAHHIDKSHKTIIPFNAMNMMWADAYQPSNRRAEWFFQADTVNDADVDGELVNYGMLLGNALVYYVPCEQWQTFDIDDEGDFQIVEMFMEKRILQGRGPEVYYEYAGSAKDRTDNGHHTANARD